MEIRYDRTSLLHQPTESCPFCGAAREAAAVTEIHRYEGMQRRFLVQITCRCGASGPARATVPEAVQAWNRAREGEPPLTLSAAPPCSARQGGSPT